MAIDTQTTKEAVWLACKSKHCCYVATVLPTGRDVWRIARTLDVPPWVFTRFVAWPTPRPDAFVLDGSGRQFRLALAKQPPKRKNAKSPPPCAFLMRTNRGHHRCSLGSLRPLTCQSFPSELVSRVVCLNPSGCDCRDWNLSDVDIEEEREVLLARNAETREYEEVVGRWNERVATAAESSETDFLAFCRYLLETYDALEPSTGGAA